MAAPSLPVVSKSNLFTNFVKKEADYNKIKLIKDGIQKTITELEGSVFNAQVVLNGFKSTGKDYEEAKMKLDKETNKLAAANLQLKSFTTKYILYNNKSKYLKYAPSVEPYESKYLKYKQKYLELKKQVGGFTKNRGLTAFFLSPEQYKMFTKTWNKKNGIYDLDTVQSSFDELATMRGVYKQAYMVPFTPQYKAKQVIAELLMKDSDFGNLYRDEHPAKITIPNVTLTEGLFKNEDELKKVLTTLNSNIVKNIVNSNKTKMVLPSPEYIVFIEINSILSNKLKFIYQFTLNNNQVELNKIPLLGTGTHDSFEKIPREDAIGYAARGLYGLAAGTGKVALGIVNNPLTMALIAIASRR